MKHSGSIASRGAILVVLTWSGYAAGPGTSAALDPAFQAGSGQEQKQQPKSESKDKGTSLTGCVDEREGRYVLVDGRSLSPIANLEADGFPTEGFAKHLGHTVTVRGTSNSAGARPTFKVRSIETVSESCGPRQ